MHNDCLNTLWQIKFAVNIVTRAHTLLFILYLLLQQLNEKHTILLYAN